MTTYKVGYLIGSLAKTSINRKLAKALVKLAPPQMNAPEAYIHFTPNRITDDGEVTNEGTEKFLRTYMSEFHIFIARVLSVLPRDA